MLVGKLKECIRKPYSKIAIAALSSIFFLSTVGTPIINKAEAATPVNPSQKVRWDPNIESDIAGYILYKKAGSSAPWESAVVYHDDVCSTDECTYTYENLQPETTYYYKVRAFDTAGFISDDSDIISGATGGIVYIDEDLPEFTIAAYPDITTNPDITLTGTATDAESPPVTLDMDGTPIPLDVDGNWSKDITLVEGDNSFLFTAEDNEGINA